MSCRHKGSLPQQQEQKNGAPIAAVEASFTVDNLLNEFYIPYPVPRSGNGENQADVLLAVSQPGRVFKGSVKVSFGTM